jgi:hypothetical protein
VLLKPIGLHLPLVAEIASARDYMMQIPSLPRIYDGASLMIAQLATQTGVLSVYGKIVAGYG